MDLGMNEKVSSLVKDVKDMINNDIVPLESEFFAEVAN